MRIRRDMDGYGYDLRNCDGSSKLLLNFATNHSSDNAQTKTMRMNTAGFEDMNVSFSNIVPLVACGVAWKLTTCQPVKFLPPKSFCLYLCLVSGMSLEFSAQMAMCTWE